MLDILMPVHRLNLPLVARRVLNEIEGSLPSVVDLVGTPGKVVLSVQGGDRQDFEAAEAYLDSQALAWQIVHDDEIGDYRDALMRGLEQCQSQLVAVIPPWIEVTDTQWVQRMIWPIGKDQTCLLCGTMQEQGAARDLAPYIVAPRIWPGGDFFVARRQQLVENLVLSQSSDDIYGNLAEDASLNGWRIWAHPGVRFTYHEHHAHTRKEAPERIRPATPSAGSGRSSAPLQ